jgi:hypothetical protein
MSMPGFTAEASLYKTSRYHPMKTFDRTEEVIHLSLIYEEFSPSHVCYERYEECLANSIGSFEACLCNNEHSICRRSYGLPAPPPRRCFFSY